MISWSPFPFVRVTACFLIGILLSLQTDSPSNISAGATIAALVIFLYVRKVVIDKGFFTHNFLIGASAFLLLGLAGFYRTSTAIERSRPSMMPWDKVSGYQVMLVDFPVDKGKNTRVLGELQTVRVDSTWVQANGKISITVSAYNDSSINFKYGHKLLVKGKPTRPRGPQNPHEFDYRNYLEHQGIHLQHFASSNDLVVLGTKTSHLKSLAFEYRELFKNILQRFTAEDTRPVVLALVIGVRDLLDNSMKEAYAAAGAMHILAVSGLHVGIIYGILMACLGRLRRYKHGRVVLIIASLALLWSYALVTGLSPSVLRASTMFSFIAIAQNSGRQTNIYNTLAASAFFLLLYNPLIITSVGFQLSYVAVIGIVYLQQRFYRLINCRWWILDKMWALTTVSLAAQIATFPISVYYFHQFPTYFFVSNLVVIPAAFLILAMGLSLIAFSAIELVAGAVGKVIDVLVGLNNKFVLMIEGLPLSTISPITLSGLQSALIYVFIVAVALLFAYRKVRYLKLAAASWILVFLLEVDHVVQKNQATKFIAYSVPGYTNIDFIDSGKLRSYRSSSDETPTSKIDYHIQPNRNALGLPYLPSANMVHKRGDDFDLISWNGQTIGVLKRLSASELPFSLDYLIVANNAINDFAQLAKFQFQFLVIDSSNKFYIAERLKTKAEELNLPHYSLLHSGALEVNL